MLVLIKSVMVMSDYLPIFLYLVPFAAAIGVLVHARTEKQHATPIVGDIAIVACGDDLAEQMRPEPVRRRYISYSI